MLGTIDMAAALKPLVSFHWGAPKLEWVAALKAAGINVWEQVGSVAEVVRAVDSGVDVVTAHGSEAGGHNCGSVSTTALLPAMRRALPNATVLAAGGIVDSASLAAALCLGGRRRVGGHAVFGHARIASAPRVEAPPGG